ncbi:MAG TPA: hypothetical protein PKK10_11025 [Woeseiaceae bacterium]|nr:hypothetical protein [Woeseiaceae bacterium]
MSDAVDRGITVTEIASIDHPIDVYPETTAAFVGRALRGPLNTPVQVKNFGEFRRTFGDVWSRSSLGPAVRQFFEHGGQDLYVVRVANNARGALLCLPASGSALVLRAVDPGSTERVRASVDYDGIDTADNERFNLTLQRIDPATGLVVDQEIYSRLSYLGGAETFVGDALLGSRVARVEQPYPQHRPERTTRGSSRYDLTWVEAVQPGTDGNELSDYDVIGSRKEATALFALEQLCHFDLLYLPPPGKGRDTGPAAILAAEMYCRQRGAMLIVDPSERWKTTRDAIGGVRSLGMASPNLITYFPRLFERREHGSAAQRPAGFAAAVVAGGALAGLISKLDRNFGPWHELDGDTLSFKSSLIPCAEIDEDEAYTLARAGINAIIRNSARRVVLTGSVTMARGSESHRVFKSLPVRRLCLRVVNTVNLATRWAVFEKPDKKLNARIRGQILAYLSSLYEMGALANDHFVVQCDAGLSNRDDRLEHGVTLLLVFQPLGSAIPVSFTVHQTVLGCRVASTAFAPVAERCA